MSVVNYSVSKDKTISFYVTNQGYSGTVQLGHENYDRILHVLRNAGVNRESGKKVRARLSRLVNVLGTVISSVKNINVHADAVSYKGKKLRGVIVDKILEFAKKGQGYAQLALFLDKTMENPSDESREAMFDWLEKSGLIIHEDGDILGYKSVRKDFKDWHTATFDNSIGNVVREKRELLNTDRNVACGKGLHVGDLSYVKDFHPNDSNIIVVKVNPKDVISVPFDANCKKMRVCEYQVIDKLDDESVEALNQDKYLSTVSNDYVDEDDDYDDDEQEYCDCGEFLEDCNGDCQDDDDGNDGRGDEDDDYWDYN